MFSHGQFLWGLILSFAYLSQSIEANCSNYNEPTLDTYDSIREVDVGSHVMVKCCISVAYSLTWLKQDGSSEKEIPNFFSIQKTSGSPVYTLPDVSDKNFQSAPSSGTYLCRSGSRHASIVLKERTDTLQITADENVLLPVASVGRIACLVQSSSGYRVSWFFKGQYISQVNNDDANNHYRLLNQSQILELNPVKETDSGQYLCKVESLDTSLIEIKPIQVKVFLPPSFTEDSPRPEKDRTKEWGELRLECNAVGIPSPRIEWQKNGEALIPVKPRIEVTSKIINSRQTSSVLTLKNVTWLDVGNYSCLAYLDQLEGLQKKNFSRSISPRLIFHPQFTKDTQLDGETEQGNEITLRCQSIGGSGDDLRIELYHNNQLLYPRGYELYSRYSIHIQNLPLGKAVILTIKDIQPEERGSYSCLASTDMGSSSKSGEVKVYYPPTVIASSDEVLGIPHQENTLSCRATSGEPMPQWVWTFNDQNVAYNPDYTQIPAPPVSSMTSRLMVAPNIRSVYGTYNCTALNSAGKASSRITLRKANRPEAPNVTVCEISSTWLKFCLDLPTWKPEQSAEGFLPLSYIDIRYRKANEKQMFDFTIPIDSTIRVNNLIPDQEYRFAISLVSPAGRSRSNLQELQTLPLRNPVVQLVEASEEEVGPKSYPLKWTVNTSSGSVPIQDYIIRVTKVQDPLEVSSNNDKLKRMGEYTRQYYSGDEDGRHQVLIHSLSPRTKYKLCVTMRGLYSITEVDCLTFKTAKASESVSLVLQNKFLLLVSLCILTFYLF